MVQFHTVNSNAKSVPTDLSLDLLKTRAAQEERFMSHLIDTEQGWKVSAQTLIESLSKRGVWTGKIRFANQPKGATRIESSSFASCLKRALAQDNFSIYQPDRQVAILDA